MNTIILYTLQLVVAVISFNCLYKYYKREKRKHFDELNGFDK